MSVEAELRLLVAEVSEVPVDLDDPAMRELSPWQLGLTSAGIVRLLAGIEDRFGVEWDIDSPADALSSFRTLVDFVERSAAR